MGPGGFATGFGRVFRRVLGHLCDTFEVVHFSPNLIEEPLPGPYPVLPRQVRGDVFGREALPEILDEFDPDLVLLFHDPPFWSVHRETIAAHQSKSGGRPFCAFYCPIEWPDINPEILRGMKGVDLLVLYTRFGLEVTMSAFRESPSEMPPAAIIPHGVDTEIFRPLFGGSRRQAKRHLFPSQPELWDSFMVLNANRNCPRKRLDLTMEAFALLTLRHSDLYLYLHTGMEDCGIDVLDYAEQLGIRDRLVVTHMDPKQPQLCDEELNLIYNACDIGLNTSSGEGWGLVSFEHAATGAPQIVPGHTACRENWLGRAEVLPVEDGLVSVEDIAEAIERLYLDRGLRRTLSDIGLEYVHEPRFEWCRIGEEWRRLLLSAL
ncbi:MAG: hypothetical protein GC165_09115 [Armatimonadetes bacterium]|nr:hypothetical protein [Armatimonadota bacterium]MBS1728710.1 glycosyltransferase [Armatimonadota bacterium]